MAATAGFGVAMCTNYLAPCAQLHCGIRMTSDCTSQVPMSVKLEHPIGRTLASRWGPGCQGAENKNSCPLPSAMKGGNPDAKLLWDCKYSIHLYGSQKQYQLHILSFGPTESRLFLLLQFKEHKIQ